MPKFRNTFVEAIEFMVRNEEFDKILNFALLTKKPKIKRDIKLIMSCIDDNGHMIPGSSVPLINDLKSPEVMKSIIYFMGMR